MIVESYKQAYKPGFIMRGLGLYLGPSLMSTNVKISDIAIYGIAQATSDLWNNSRH